MLDLAAGTGKLTRQLVPLGARVVAVEPIDAMRAELERAVPGVEALAGTAEAIPLAEQSVDAVTCAQAFHWFRPDQAVREIRRVLRPGGGLALLWNGRDLDDPKHERVDELLAPHRREFPGGEEHWRSVLGPLELRTWHYAQTLALGRVRRPGGVDELRGSDGARRRDGVPERGPRGALAVRRATGAALS